MRSTSGRPQSTKSVQWVSDLKKRPQDISSDRKIVKVQVGKKRGKQKKIEKKKKKFVKISKIRWLYSNTYFEM